MSIRRVVPVLHAADPQAAAEVYRAVLGMQLVMDHGWIVTVADADDPSRQLSLLARDATAEVDPVVSIELDTPDDVDAAHDAAIAAGASIAYPLSDEEWGVRRFFFRDLAGNVVNVLAHR